MLLKQVFFLVPICFLLLSCGNPKKLIYFNNQPDANIPVTTTIPESIIKQNDLLSINVTSQNPEASAAFNAPNTTTTSMVGESAAGVTIQTTGFLVKSDGFIHYPILGKIKAEGLTTDQLSDKIASTLSEKKLLVDPIVTVRYLNFRVTVLGEVGKPTVINVPDEKISLLEAQGLAGDITIFGKKDNELLIREENGEKLIKRMNLNTSELFNSPYYYLKSNDILYVEPNKAKMASSTRVVQLLPIMITALSFAIIVLSQVLK